MAAEASEFPSCTGTRPAGNLRAMAEVVALDVTPSKAHSLEDGRRLRSQLLPAVVLISSDEERGLATSSALAGDNLRLQARTSRDLARDVWQLGLHWLLLNVARPDNRR